LISRDKKKKYLGIQTSHIFCFLFCFCFFLFGGGFIEAQYHGTPKPASVKLKSSIHKARIKVIKVSLKAYSTNFSLSVLRNLFMSLISNASARADDNLFISLSIQNSNLGFSLAGCGR
jgi:hypothetical protein